VPPLVASLLVLAGLPVFLAAGWSLRSWGLAAALWAGAQVFSLSLARLPLGAGKAGSSAVVGFAMTFRSLAVGVVLILVAVSDARMAVAAALLYALAFTLELALTLISYFSAEPLG
jgi:hypothetical protein